MTPFPDEFVSDRLRYERLCHDAVDVFALHEVYSPDEETEDITTYMPWDPRQTVVETAEFVDWCEAGREAGEHAPYLVRPREGEDGAGEIAGVTRLECDWERRTAMLELWLRKRFWGRGYSGERAGALIEIAFEHLDLELVSVNHQDGNDLSKRAIEKYVDRFGGQYDGLLRNWGPRPAEGRVVDAHRYTITREQYRKAIDDSSIDRGP
jgi:RimJ/RimL family protein N-acetyltransferase